MRWVLALALLIGSAVYLYDRYQRLDAPAAVPPAPPALSSLPAPDSFLAVAEIKRIRGSVSDPDPGVRWAALEFLFNVRDPEAVDRLSKAVAEDPDPALRLKGIELLKRASAVPILKLQGLIKALSDVDPSIRIASLKAIGDVGDAHAAPWVADALKDYDPDVRTQALHTLGQFQDKRKEEFKALAEQLKAQYETAVRKSQEQQE